MQDQLAQLVDEMETSIRFEAPERAQALGTGPEYQAVWWVD